MTLFSREKFADPDDDYGVFISGLGAAITTFVATQDGTACSVEGTATIFNTTPDVIREAVNQSPWAFLYDHDGVECIDLDGE